MKDIKKKKQSQEKGRILLNYKLINERRRRYFSCLFIIKIIKQFIVEIVRKCDMCVCVYVEKINLLITCGGGRLV